MSASNFEERNFRNPDEMEPEQMLKNLSIEENEDTSAQKQHCSLLEQITVSATQCCNLRPSTCLGTFGNAHVNDSHDFNADSDNYNKWKEYDGKNKNMKHELERNLSHCHCDSNRSEALDTLGNVGVSKELQNKGTSTSLEDNLVEQKLDSAPPSCHANKGPYHYHNNSNNYLGVEMKYEPLINSNISHNSNGISGPELLDACSRLPVNSDTMQSYAQEMTCTVDGSFETQTVNKDAFLSNDTIFNSLLPRSANKESSIPFSSRHWSRDTHTLNLKPEVSDVKEELSLTEEETDGIKTSYISFNFQSGCGKHACAQELTSVQCSDSAEVADVKQVTLDCTGVMDVENLKEEMLSVGNISCASYNLRSINQQGSSSKHDSPRYKEDTNISMSDSSENCKSHSVDDMLIKWSPTYRMSSTRSFVPSRNLYYNLRKRDVNLRVKKETDSEKNDKKHIYYKKISGYNLRPRNAHGDELTSGPKGTYILNHNPNRRYLQVKQIIGAQVENQSPISTRTSCGTYNLRPRNSLVSGSVCKKGPRIRSSSLGITCKSVNVEDVVIKQETSVCHDNIFLYPTLNCKKNNLHNCSSNDVILKLNAVTHSGYTQLENDIVISANMPSRTYNLRPRTKQGSIFLSLQHEKGSTICSSNLSHSHKPDIAQDIKVREIKQEATISDVDSCSRSYNMCSRVLYQKVGDLGVDLKLEDEIIDDKRFYGKISPYNLRHHCRNDLCNYSESNLYKNNSINSTKIVAAEDATPRISVKCCQLHDKKQALEESASACNSIHAMSSERSVSYHLRSRCVVKEIKKDSPFKKGIKEEKGSEAENALFETSKTVSGESIPIKSSKDVNAEHFEQQLVGMNEIWHPSVIKSVSTKGIGNLGDVAFVNDSKFACTKESFSENLEQEVVAKCADVITSAQGRSVVDINEMNLDEIICLRSERHLQRNVGSQKHFVFHNESPELELLQNSQSHESCIGQDEIQAFGDKKHGEEMDCFQSNTRHLCPSRIRSKFEPCEKQDMGTEACLSPGHRSSPSNNLALSEKVEIDCIEYPGSRGETTGGLLSQTNVPSYDPLNNFSSLHAGSDEINNQDVFVTGLRSDLACNDNTAETGETLEDTKNFPCIETSFMQDVNSTWQQTNSDAVGSIHKEEGLSLPNNADVTKDEELLQADNIMIIEQKVFCVDNTHIAEEQKYVGDISLSQSNEGLSKDLLNIGNDPKGSGTLYETDAVDFDVNGTNIIEISVPQKAGNDCKKSDISIPVEMSLPEIGDTVTAKDFNMDGPDTQKISAVRESLLIEDDRDRIHEAIDSQDRNDSDVDMAELCMSIPVPKMSLVSGPVARFGMHALFMK
jgi:hypothetical protein